MLWRGVFSGRGGTGCNRSVLLGGALGLFIFCRICGVADVHELNPWEGLLAKAIWLALEILQVYISILAVTAT